MAEPTFSRTISCLSAYELLRPVSVIITDADQVVIRIHNIGTMPFTVHPGFYNVCRSFLSHGNVLSSIAVTNSELLHHIERRAVGRGSMVKIVVLAHILRLCQCHIVKFGISRERLQSLLRALLIHQRDHLGCKLRFISAGSRVWLSWLCWLCWLSRLSRLSLGAGIAVRFSTWLASLILRRTILGCSILS
ncbi:hypothetical protein D3C73_1111330 [compost metagenome]